MRAKTIVLGVAALLGVAVTALPAQAGDSSGNFQAKLGVTGIIFDDETTSTAPLPLGTAEVNDTVIPTLALTYYLTNNWAVELFCCFAQVNVDGKSGALGSLGKLGSTWVFPPILTAQYHFDGMGPIKPYVGAGVQWIHYFDEKSNIGGGADFDDSWGFVLQGGVDYDLGQGWSLGIDVKKAWLDTKVSYNGGPFDGVSAKQDLDPLYVTANLGYRFNLSDLFGSRTVEPLK